MKTITLVIVLSVLLFSFYDLFKILKEKNNPCLKFKIKELIYRILILSALILDNYFNIL
jgi:hypothetical protein